MWDQGTCTLSKCIANYELWVCVGLGPWRTAGTRSVWRKLDNFYNI